MRTREVEFFFDFGSPTTYLAYTQLPQLATDCGAQIVWRPMLLGGVFKATGNNSPVAVPAKGRWMHQDMGRWAQCYGVSFALNPHFPINTLALMRGAVGYQMKRPQAFGPYLEAVFRAMWVTGRNLGDSAELAATLGVAGLDSGEFIQMIGDPDVKAKLVADTAEAVERGVFGAPSFFVGKEMFFGQDRLEFVRSALLGR